MNDYHLDPPDDQEPPEWYMTLEDILEQMDPPQIVADAIRKAMDEWVQEYNKQHDVDPPADIEDLQDCDNSTEQCPHGKDWYLCGACEYAADIAFDAARENRFFKS